MDLEIILPRHQLAVLQILKTNGIDPAPHRSEVPWSQFLHSQAAIVCDFFYSGVTANPTGPWTTQSAPPPL